MKMKRMTIKLACAGEEIIIIFLEGGIAHVSTTHLSFIFVVPSRPFSLYNGKMKFMLIYFCGVCGHPTPLRNLTVEYLLENDGRRGGGSHH